MRNETQPARIIYTIGHSNRALAEFIAILKQHGIEMIVDVRTVPRSRANPQFNRESLPDALETQEIGYRHMPGLGGLRRPRPDSANTAWRNDTFRGYADYMQTEEFATNLAQLAELARSEMVAVMCAEAVPWRCHRSLIGDALLVRGFEVEDIISQASIRPHRLTPWAKVEGQRITYPAE